MAHLLSLPPEVLHSICASLCNHCNGPPSQDPYGGCFKGAQFCADNKPRLMALSAMTQTCTALRDIARPYLYHYPCIEAVSRFLPRTIVERPDLAHHVKELSVFDMMCQEEVSAELVGILRTFLREHEDVEGGTALQEARQSVWYLDPSKDEVDGFEDIFNTLFTAMVLTKVPNLECLHLELDHAHEFPFCQPDSLPHLKELVVQHWDTEGGADITRSIGPILLAAPALERLKGLLIGSAKWEEPTPLRHEGLKEIFLVSSAVGPEDISTLLGSFPRLEAFSYESGGGNEGWDEASPRQIGEAVLLCKDTLRFLAIDCTDSCLVKLKKLQKLRLDGPSLFRDSTGTAGGMTICEMLPSSMVEVEIIHPKLNILNEILELARVASQRFPALRRVSVAGFEQDTNNVLRQAFGQTEIEFWAGNLEAQYPPELWLIPA
ncbi:hypothetical protein BHE90_003030 [Fusarium euwallaceae]|uniref:F-box domain-containing protein n=1 Tax=Fusarium euwallaceae TaxID=1147111 RepID=A0A430M362_9HYPO|nr:hypothetical protein BHE90_003030 [Fusarium euwallaceae]